MSAAEHTEASTVAATTTAGSKVLLANHGGQHDMEVGWTWLCWFVWYGICQQRQYVVSAKFGTSAEKKSWVKHPLEAWHVQVGKIG